MGGLVRPQRVKCYLKVGQPPMRSLGPVISAITPYDVSKLKGAKPSKTTGLGAMVSVIHVGD
jgi:hypothetical protein